MAKPIATIRAHHAEILKELKKIPQTVAGVKADSVDAWREALEEIVGFLEDDLKPHAEGEEQFLYPVVDDLVKRYERATATMSLDHVRITEEIETFKTQTEKLLELAKSKAGTEEIQAAIADLLETAHHLDAVLSLHLDKEERILLPLAEQYLSEAEAQRILDQMHGEHHKEHG
jgi:iron-sulfur cluster repair protein YtfE (RIC family)